MKIAYLKFFLVTLFMGLFLIVSNHNWAKEEGLRYHRKPIELEEMKQYQHITFKIKNFESLDKGMTEEEVLNLLGKPLNMKKEHRRHNRWTVHYFYPDGHVVNFRNGVVVGKE